MKQSLIIGRSLDFKRIEVNLNLDLKFRNRIGDAHAGLRIDHSFFVDVDCVSLFDRSLGSVVLLHRLRDQLGVFR